MALSRGSPRALEIGISLGGLASPADWQRAFDRVMRAEALGLHSVWIPEGHFAPGATPAPLVALSAFAARTQRLRLGTTSLLLPIHPPLRVASEVASLDALSSGRVWLGLGRGFRRPQFAAFGVEPSTKRDRFDAALDTILAAWADPNGGPRPVQRPHPPLLVAAFGRKGLDQAARRGLPYLASPLETLDALADNVAYHRERMREGGRDPAPLRVPVIRTVHVAGNDAEARRVLAAHSAEARRVAASVPRALARAAAGSPQERVLVGTPAAVSDRLAVYRERLGLDLLIARSEVPGASESERTASLERLVSEVLPAHGSDGT